VDFLNRQNAIGLVPLFYLHMSFGDSLTAMIIELVDFVTYRILWGDTTEANYLGKFGMIDN
jgi:hypothetical protein